MECFNQKISKSFLVKKGNLIHKTLREKHMKDIIESFENLSVKDLKKISDFIYFSDDISYASGKELN